ncbi:MAG: YidC/Oxa1 family membrane protein insertase [Patescibacteria group bacterium]|nr:YidC/Oxa1 family membrane protein insertase [Patescibacteria group bacterium]
MNNLFQAIFYQPILNLLVFLYNNLGDLGLAIIFLTLIIKLILLPLSKKSIKSQKALQELQPKIDELKAKFKGDKQAMSLSLMALYKQNKVNPFSSCLPLLIQLPFFIAIFKVFRDGFAQNHLDLLYPFVNNPELINTVSFGFFDLSQRSVILAILAGIAQFWQGKMMVAKKPEIKTEGSKDENMLSIMNKQMLYIMPGVTVLIGLSFPAGLTFYWFLTTLFTALQQKIVFRGSKKKEEENIVKVIE